VESGNCTYARHNVKRGRPNLYLTKFVRISGILLGRPIGLLVDPAVACSTPQVYYVNCVFMYPLRGTYRKSGGYVVPHTAPCGAAPGCSMLTNLFIGLFSFGDDLSRVPDEKVTVKCGIHNYWVVHFILTIYNSFYMYCIQSIVFRVYNLQ